MRNALVVAKKIWYVVERLIDVYMVFANVAMTIHVLIQVSIASLENACVELNQVAKEKEQDLIAMLWVVHVNARELLIPVRPELIVITENAAVKVWFTLM